jgi:EF-P beta-lysylation protein EpmB
MIAADPHARHTAALSDLNPPTWQQELARAVRDPLELLDLLQLTPAQIAPGETADSLLAAAALFPLRVPRGFVDRMRVGDPRDPLLRQVLPVGTETLPVAGFVADPLQEVLARAVPGLLHKYAGRALLVTTGACAVHCRYCFRRHYDYGSDQDVAAAQRWSAALAHVAADTSIHEMILSGGDPLSLSNARLAHLLRQIQGIAHVQRVRIHTRTPIVLPARVDAGLLSALLPLRDRLAIVVHANHPNELDAETAAALRRLGNHCTALLNQSVLLAGINDDAAILADLSQRLFEAGVLPYYLHQLDAVAGASHHSVDDARAVQIHSALAASLSGYLVPQLVREVPGASGKTPVR